MNEFYFNKTKVRTDESSPEPSVSKSSKAYEYDQNVYVHTGSGGWMEVC